MPDLKYCANCSRQYVPTATIQDFCTRSCCQSWHERRAHKTSKQTGIAYVRDEG